MDGEGIVFNIQRYSIDDGPGVRTTVFVKGCPLRCLWCSNPESLDPAPEITYRYTSCKKCGACVQACLEKGITLDDEGIHINRAICKKCGTCASVCIPEALKMSGKKMTVEEVFKVIKKDADYYEASGGGVTCSGGEILTQPSFVAAIFKRCREAGINTCADTSGLGSKDAMKMILEHCDLVYFDLKILDSAEHQKICGQPNDVIIANLSLIAEEKIPVVLRFPLIPGYTDSENNITALAGTAARLAKNAPIHILPYHKYGANKYRMLDMVYPLDHVEDPDPQQMERAKDIIESHGLACKIVK
jgi:pyruvate formate lyase activating enzyme